MIDVEQTLREAPHLEALPQSIAKLAGLVGRELPHMGPVVDVIQYDTGLTMRLLRAANAAANGNRVPISTVQNAVVYLGTGTVLSLAMSSAVGRSSQRALSGYRLGHGELWRHCVIASVAAEATGPLLGKSIPADASTAALLHDVGKTALDKFLRGERLQAAREAGLDSTCRATAAAAETVALGIDHAEMGALLAQRWRLPETIVQAIRYHHSPSAYAQEPDAAARVQQVCDAVHLADLVVQVITHSDRHPGDVIDVAIDAEARRRLGLSDRQFRALCEQTASRMGAAISRYAIAARARAPQRAA